MSDEIDEDGFFVDESGNQWGYCNACGEEAPVAGGCCDEGEVFPIEQV